MGDQRKIWMVTVNHFKNTDSACGIGYGPIFYEEDKDDRVNSLEAGDGMCHKGCTPHDEGVELNITESLVDIEIWKVMRDVMLGRGD